eukprot:CAMPEP_0194757774 /NCGR_PEP_ID=MMETSP0323_2-20130528/11198_1 /TAXON_ID=2866 ORGANISM="Crypthecodinium cohnii, Strain Seligo" /NCGR_SAMPLE_ID=MMETSP0323_2 /ASSEMBLY_ACC=CAM_ASM_000346 /LENGTH=122 /DNA_ID=CAMNT_0039677845 /DNA_START=177 /DNA_END=545 /DNA_ORIENTATION=-
MDNIVRYLRVVDDLHGQALQMQGFDAEQGALLIHTETVSFGKKCSKNTILAAAAPSNRLRGVYETSPGALDLVAALPVATTVVSRAAACSRSGPAALAGALLYGCTIAVAFLFADSCFSAAR